MKLMKKEFARVLLVMSVLCLAVCERKDSYAAQKEQLDAALARTQQRIQQHAIRMEEKERKHQALLKSINEDMGQPINVTSRLEELEEISRRSTSDMRRLIEELEQKRHAALQDAREGIQREEEEIALLRQRWWSAKETLLQSKREEEAVIHASLQKAEAAASWIEVALDEAERLHQLQQKIDPLTERGQDLLQETRKEGIIRRWWRHLSSLFLVRNISKEENVDENVTPKGGTSTSPVEAYPPLVPMSIVEHEDWDTDPADDEDEAEEPAINDDPEGLEAEAEEPSAEDDPVSVSGSDTDTEEHEVENISGSETDSEAPLPSHPTFESISKGGDTVPTRAQVGGTSPHDLKQNCPKKTFKWLVYLHVVLSLVIGAVRVYGRFYDRRRLGAVRRRSPHPEAQAAALVPPQGARAESPDHGPMHE